MDSGYTKDELKAIAEYRDKDPNCFCWGTKDGLVIPLHMIKDSHLRNILRHVHNLPDRFTPFIVRTLEDEQHKRLTKTLAGKVLYGRN